MRKGQAAMEFLMTYGWAILVVLVAIGALAYFGVLSPQKFLPRSCTIGPGIGCDDFKVSTAANTIVLELRNGMGESLSVVDIAITGCTDSAEADGNDAWADSALLGGDDGITLTACPDTLIGAVGTRTKTDVTITYTSASGIPHTKTGSLTSEVEA